MVARRIAEGVLEGQLVVSEDAAFRGLSTHISVHGTVVTVGRKPRHFTGAQDLYKDYGLESEHFPF